MLRVSHFLHLRCAVPMPNVVAEAAELIGRSDVRLLSLMDHIPGQRQFRDQQKLRDYYRGKNASVSDVQLDALFGAASSTRRPMRPRIIALLSRSRATMLYRWQATMTPRWSMSSKQLRTASRSPKFPTTVEAAQALHRHGFRVLMRAPNVVRGRSHAGNVATVELAGCRAGSVSRRMARMSCFMH